MKQLILILFLFTSYISIGQNIQCDTYYTQMPIINGNRYPYQLRCPQLVQTMTDVRFDIREDFVNLGNAPYELDDEFYFKWAVLDGPAWIPVYYGCQSSIPESRYSGYRSLSVQVWRYNNRKRTIVSSPIIGLILRPTKTAPSKKNN